MRFVFVNCVEINYGSLREKWKSFSRATPAISAMCRSHFWWMIRKRERKRNFQSKHPTHNIVDDNKIKYLHRPKGKLLMEEREKLWKSHQFTLLRIENIFAKRKFPISYLSWKGGRRAKGFLFVDSLQAMASLLQPGKSKKEKLLRYSKNFFFAFPKTFCPCECFWNSIWSLIDKRTKWGNSLIFHWKLLTFVRGRVWSPRLSTQRTLFDLLTYLRICFRVDKLTVDAKQDDWYQARYHAEQHDCVAYGMWLLNHSANGNEKMQVIGEYLHPEELKIIECNFPHHQSVSRLEISWSSLDVSWIYFSML